MNESTFLCLLFIFILYNKDKYDRNFLDDFKKQVIKCFKVSNNITDFRLRFSSSSLELPEKDFKFRLKFIKFLSENNKLLGYQC